MKETDRQTDIHTSRQAGRQTDKDRERGWNTDRQTGRQIDIS